MNPVLIKNKIKNFFSVPANCMLVLFFVIFLGLSIYPIIAMTKEMFVVHPGIEKTLTGQKNGSFTFISRSCSCPANGAKRLSSSR